MSPDSKVGVGQIKDTNLKNDSGRDGIAQSILGNECVMQ